QDNTNSDIARFDVTDVVAAGLTGIPASAFTINPPFDDMLIRDATDGTWGRFDVEDVLQAMLKGLGNTKGNLIYHNGSNYVALAPP
ncbi:MAG: hypothetical protein MJA84_00685, partial [Firmicutes bacterium]|nr:hypothetical protein [Bacillota bacterium]